MATSEFIYNGIAEVYDEKNSEKVKYHIRYDARVRAGIDIKDVDFEINKESRIVEVTLPDIKIFSPPSVTPSSLSYIPSDKTFDLKEVLETCEADVIREAEEAVELKRLASDNLRAIIEALLTPIVKPEGYTLKWK